MGTLLSGQAQTQVNTWASDLQSKITSWLQPLQQGKTALQLAIDDTNSSFLLTDFTFDITQPGFGGMESGAKRRLRCGACRAQQWHNA